MPRSSNRSRSGGSWARVVIAYSVSTMLGVAGFGFLLAGLGAMRPGPPLPPYAAPVPGATVWASQARLAGLARSEPARIDIPTLDVHATVAPVGVGSDGAVGIPPLSQPHLTGWYRYGPSPGEVGSAVILGHVDSYASGKAVFYDLGRLKSGQEIAVTRRDQTTATFRVDAVSAFSKSMFPTSSVFGHVDYPGLRLITCGGPFDSGSGSYRDNIIVFASLTGIRRPNQLFASW